MTLPHRTRRVSRKFLSEKLDVRRRWVIPDQERTTERLAFIRSAVHDRIETPKERCATGGPRRSILERYPNAQSYVAAITAAARQLVEERLMLEEDVERAPSQPPPTGVAPATK
jgi:Alpha/beta hydrolase domain